MRFRLTENRIDDLKRMIDMDISRRQIEKEIQSYIDHIGLLSVEETKKIEADVDSGLLKEDILKWPSNDQDQWWLCSHGATSRHAAGVYRCGYADSFGNLINSVQGVRPILCLKSKILIPYEEYTVYDEHWIAISRDILLYNGNKLVEHIFDEQTNDYENSEIKRYVENDWLNEIRNM